MIFCSRWAQEFLSLRWLSFSTAHDTFHDGMIIERRDQNHLHHRDDQWWYHRKGERDQQGFTGSTQVPKETCRSSSPWKLLLQGLNDACHNFSHDSSHDLPLPLSTCPQVLFRLHFIPWFPPPLIFWWILSEGIWGRTCPLEYSAGDEREAMKFTSDPFKPCCCCLLQVVTCGGDCLSSSRLIQSRHQDHDHHLQHPPLDAERESCPGKLVLFSDHIGIKRYVQKHTLLFLAENPILFSWEVNLLWFSLSLPLADFLFHLVWVWFRAAS